MDIWCLEACSLMAGWLDATWRDFYLLWHKNREPITKVGWKRSNPNTEGTYITIRPIEDLGPNYDIQLTRQCPRENMCLVVCDSCGMRHSTPSVSSPTSLDAVAQYLQIWGGSIIEHNAIRKTRLYLWNVCDRWQSAGHLSVASSNIWRFSGQLSAGVIQDRRQTQGHSVNPTLKHKLPWAHVVFDCIFLVKVPSIPPRETSRFPPDSPLEFPLGIPPWRLYNS